VEVPLIRVARMRGWLPRKATARSCLVKKAHQALDRGKSTPGGGGLAAVPCKGRRRAAGVVDEQIRAGGRISLYGRKKRESTFWPLSGRDPMASFLRRGCKVFVSWGLLKEGPRPPLGPRDRSDSPGPVATLPFCSDTGVDVHSAHRVQVRGYAESRENGNSWRVNRPQNHHCASHVRHWSGGSPM